MAANEGYSRFEAFCTFCKSSASSERFGWFTYYFAFATDVVENNCVYHKAGDVLRYSRDGFTQLCSILEVVDPCEHTMRYKVKLKCDRVMFTDPMFLQNPSDLDIAKVLVTEGDYENDLPNLTKAESSYLAHPTPLSKDDQEWLKARDRLNHMSRKDMCRLAENGVLPKKLAKYKYRAPFCASCAFGKAHKRQWTSKGKHYNHIISKKDNQSGARVSVDQLISAQPGLVPQTGGTLTRSRIHCSTIFIDHHSSFAYSFLQRSKGHEEMLDAKDSFEKLVNGYNVAIRSYHADNGRFSEAAFKDDCERCDQDISFCAVGTHNQNEIAKANIKTFTLGVRTSLLRAKRLWPEAITTILWPFAMQYFMECYNNFHFDDNGKSPLMKFSGIDEKSSIEHFHPFGCPVFVLDSKLQSSTKGIPKCDPRSRLGLYLGPLTLTCRVRGPGSEPKDRLCFTTISCSV